MDINTLRGLATLLVMVAFLGVCWWAFSPKRKKEFDEAAQLPFADDPTAVEADKEQKGNSDQQKDSST